MRIILLLVALLTFGFSYVTLNPKAKIAVVETKTKTTQKALYSLSGGKDLTELNNEIGKKKYIKTSKEVFFMPKREKVVDIGLPETKFSQSASGGSPSTFSSHRAWGGVQSSSKPSGLSSGVRYTTVKRSTYRGRCGR